MKHRLALLPAIFVLACGSTPHTGTPDGPKEQPFIHEGEIGTIIGTGNKATDQVDANADGKVDDVAPEQELLEVLEHCSSLRVENCEESKLNAAAAPCLDRPEWLSQVDLR